MAKRLYVENSRHNDSTVFRVCHLTVLWRLNLWEIRFMKKATLAVVGHIGPDQSGHTMRAPHALAAFAALGQPTRLEIFRVLMRAEPGGLPAGSIADLIGCPHNTLSSHLGILARSGLVSGTRDGRSIIYRADVEGIRALVSFLVTDCCDGHPELCDIETAIRNASCGCAPSDKGPHRRNERA